ncbi:hypothetical protein LOTGIDRAFT_153226 [Lottia gigantea]|uniref:PWWP domain-containing protein n=1 Tax=Lottia gigantea TaxID=225164 RepID=V4BXE1_LOTGI|nr:hypothetical protein LOTGIDRAFT_153226 [Lottia gigantea]ESO93764.1 hypothetical protein LOTGIDRAFT_153226 [Lottia gigantea]
MAGKFKVGDLVWAKMKGFPHWPGKIIEAKPDIKRPSNKKPHQFVFFFGSENYAWIAEEGVLKYGENRDKGNPSSRVPKGFKEAVEAADDLYKSMPVEEPEEDLPSIDEELAQIFPTKKKTSAKDYSREPLSGKKKKLNKPAESTSKQNKPRSKEGGRKSINKRPYSPTSSGGKSPAPQKRPKISNSVSPTFSKTPIYSPKADNKMALLRQERGFQDAFDFHDEEDAEVPSTTTNSVGVSSSTQIEENLLLNKGVFTSSKGIVPTPLRIGFLGLGIMGQGMVMNLLRSGHEVTVWNRTVQKNKNIVLDINIALFL